MTCRGLIAMALVANLLPGLAGMALAQTALPLRGTLEDGALEEQAPTTSRLAATALTVNPEEPPAPPRRRETTDDPYAPQGIGQGVLRLYPSLTIGTVYSSNVNSSVNDPKGDIGLLLKPSLRFDSDWVRHSWTGGASGNLVFYAEQNELNARSFDAFQRLRLDVRRDTQLNLDASYALDQTGTGDSNVPATAKGYETEHTLAAAAALVHDFGPLSGQVRTGVAGHIFEDVKLNGGGSQSNSDRDYIEPLLSLRMTYTDPPMLKPYVEAAYTPRIHNDSRDRNGLRRDSQGIGLTAGIEVDAGPLWTGDVGLTYLHRRYSDSALSATDAFGAASSLTWQPTELTRIVMSAGTSISETTSANVSGNPTWTARIDATQALRDNIDLSAGAGVTFEDIGAGTDTTYDANLALSWKFNPTLSWTAAYDLTWLDAGTPGRDYTEHRLSTGVTLSR
jgi:hypothetical protein